LQSWSTKESAIKAKLIWCLKSVLSNYSGSSSDGIFNIFISMFGELIPKTFTLGCTKLSYLITEALGPYFKKVVVEECQGKFYALIYDETTNAESKKELQIAIRFWSNNLKQIVVRHLETFFISSATGEELEKFIMQAINNVNLSREKL